MAIAEAARLMVRTHLGYLRRERKECKHTVLCGYCGRRAQEVSGIVIHPDLPHLHRSRFYQCAPCDAYVGCHPDTNKPLGSLADAELRAARSMAHSAFDPLWKQDGMQRHSAYAWLADQLKLPTRDCHIAMFDIATCRRVVEVCVLPDFI